MADKAVRSVTYEGSGPRGGARYRANGHLSLLDCYKNEHGACCGTCIEEAEDIDAMVRERVPETAIRDHLIARFRWRH